MSVHLRTKTFILLITGLISYPLIAQGSVQVEPTLWPEYCSSYQGQTLNLSEVTLVREEGIKRRYAGYNNLEGPVWYDGALYYSNIGNKHDPNSGEFLNNQTTIWRWQPGTEAELWLDDTLAGSNGLAVDADGQLVMARHLDGSITRVNPATKARAIVSDGFNNKRFNSPNDLTIAADGTLYFTDPDWNVPITNTQPIQGGDQQHIYRISQEGELSRTNATTLVSELGNKPNGILLSLDERELLVASLKGLWKFTRGDPLLSSPEQLMSTPIDGMGKDCAGNIYVTTTAARADNTKYQTIVILNKEYNEVGEIVIPDIQIVTNVAFGGPNRNILYITSLTVPNNDAGTGPRLCDGVPCKPAGIYSVKLNVPGFPY